MSIKQKPAFTLRVPNVLLKKIKYISVRNERSANQEIRYILTKYTQDYEKKNGEIKIEGE